MLKYCRRAVILTLSYLVFHLDECFNLALNVKVNVAQRARRNFLPRALLGLVQDIVYHDINRRDWYINGKTLKRTKRESLNLVDRFWEQVQREVAVLVPPIHVVEMSAVRVQVTVDDG